MLGYNDIYDILRKEKYSEVLQQLPKRFIEEFNEYISSKVGEANESADLFQENIAKSKKQLENSIALFKELFRIRKKKLLNLVFVATETGIMKRDYENMLSFEKEIFDELVKSFNGFDKELSNALTGGAKKSLGKQRMVIFNQSVEQFVDMQGKLIGPFASGELANLENSVAEIFVTSGKAGFVDQE